MTCNVSAQTTPSNPPPAGEKAGHHRGELAEKLGLTDDQKAKLEPIFQKERADIKAIIDNTTLTKEQKHEQISAIREATAPQVKAILTPEQYQKWEALKAEWKERHGGKKNAPAST